MFCKADKKDELTDPPIVLKSNTFTILDAVDMDEMFVNCLGEINGKIDEFIRNGSGWVLHHLVRIDLGIVRYNPLKDSSYIALPKVIKNRKSASFGVFWLHYTRRRIIHSSHYLNPIKLLVN